MKKFYSLSPFKILILVAYTTIAMFSCHKRAPVIVPLNPNTKIPNIVIILADDIGYEIPQYTGGESYQTPTLNSLATSGMQFTRCYSTPNCTPSRVMMLTGKYNFRNYTDWATLNPTEKTIANALKDKGYKTCVAGKWQLDGGDASIKAFGFENYMVWDPFGIDDTLGNEEGRGRYKNPDIYQNGSFLPSTDVKGKYADDLFTDYICNFIQNNSDRPMLIYYPMNLCHTPYSPTPDDPEFPSFKPDDDKPDIKFFPSMVRYMDKKVLQIVDKLKWAGVYNNTYIFFTGDNGTTESIVSDFKGRKIKGGKGSTNEFGTHVPLFVSGASTIQSGSINNHLIDFTDFFSTILDICNINKSSLSGYGQLDGVSFYSQLKGIESNPRSWAYCYWKPNSRVPALYKTFAQNEMYKLYDLETNKNRFYNTNTDSFELNPLKDDLLTSNQLQTKLSLQRVLDSLHN